VADTIITLRVLRKSPRTQEVLDGVAARLGRDHLAPDDLGAVHIRMNGRAPRSWDEVRDALDDTGDDWRQWLHLAPRPPR